MNPSRALTPLLSQAQDSSARNRLAGGRYECQVNGVNLSCVTIATLVLATLRAVSAGIYQTAISDEARPKTTLPAKSPLIRPPQVISTLPLAPNTNWFTGLTNLSLVAITPGTNFSPIQYQWSRDGSVVPDFSYAVYPINASAYASAPILAAGEIDGDYSVKVSNRAGSTNVGPWRVRAFHPGMVGVWGASDSGQWERPVDMTNTLAIGAGESHCIAVKEDGTVVAWGSNSYGQTNVPTGLTNIVSVAAGS